MTVVSVNAVLEVLVEVTYNDLKDHLTGSGELPEEGMVMTTVIAKILDAVGSNRAKEACILQTLILQSRYPQLAQAILDSMDPLLRDRFSELADAVHDASAKLHVLGL